LPAFVFRVSPAGTFTTARIVPQFYAQNLMVLFETHHNFSVFAAKTGTLSWKA